MQQQPAGQAGQGDAAAVASAGQSHQPHDEIHVVPPSWQPLILAIGITLVLAGIALSPVLWIAGLVISIISIVNWLTQLRRDYHAPSADQF